MELYTKLVLLTTTLLVATVFLQRNNVIISSDWCSFCTATHVNERITEQHAHDDVKCALSNQRLVIWSQESLGNDLIHNSLHSSSRSRRIGDGDTWQSLKARLRYDHHNHRNCPRLPPPRQWRSQEFPTRGARGDHEIFQRGECINTKRSDDIFPRFSIRLQVASAVASDFFAFSSR